jgi:hypothetical protein
MMIVTFLMFSKLLSNLAIKIHEEIFQCALGWNRHQEDGIGDA